MDSVPSVDSSTIITAGVAGTAMVVAGVTLYNYNVNWVKMGTAASFASRANFASVEKLENHFAKHGDEFKGIFNTAEEYLQGARDVIVNGTKVAYEYKGEIRTGYVRFMGNSSSGAAKFEFVGTNSAQEITTYHIENGNSFWRMLNSEVIKVINPIE